MDKQGKAQHEPDPEAVKAIARWVQSNFHPRQGPRVQPTGPPPDADSAVDDAGDIDPSRIVLDQPVDVRREPADQQVRWFEFPEQSAASQEEQIRQDAEVIARFSAFDELIQRFDQSRAAGVDRPAGWIDMWWWAHVFGVQDIVEEHLAENAQTVWVTADAPGAPELFGNGGKPQLGGDLDWLYGGVLAGDQLFPPGNEGLPAFTYRSVRDLRLGELTAPQEVERWLVDHGYPGALPDVAPPTMELDPEHPDEPYQPASPPTLPEVEPPTMELDPEHPDEPYQPPPSAAGAAPPAPTAEAPATSLSKDDIARMELEAELQPDLSEPEETDSAVDDSDNRPDPKPPPAKNPPRETATEDSDDVTPLADASGPRRPAVDVESRFVTVEDRFTQEIGVDTRGLQDHSEDGSLTSEPASLASRPGPAGDPDEGFGIDFAPAQPAASGPRLPRAGALAAVVLVLVLAVALFALTRGGGDTTVDTAAAQPTSTLPPAATAAVASTEAPGDATEQPSFQLTEPLKMIICNDGSSFNAKELDDGTLVDPDTGEPMSCPGSN